MYSYLNAIPLGRSAIERLRRAVAPLRFADVFGFSTGHQILGDGNAAVEASFVRYLAAIAA